VAEYIQAAPSAARTALREMRACVRAAAPGATEAIKWRMPAYSYRRILVMFAAFQRHIGFFPTSSVTRAFAGELSGYKTGKGSIQFPLDRPLPKALIRRMTALRVRESREADVKWISRGRKRSA
jgi:uncharacterized protein YdhG (YjbR/CyaY superfamily)